MQQSMAGVNANKRFTKLQASLRSLQIKQSRWTVCITAIFISLLDYRYKYSRGKCFTHMCT